MKGINCKKLTVAALLGIGVMTATLPAQARPHNRPAWNRRGRDAGAYRQFTGRALATNRSGDLMQVRADNGTTYTVRSTAFIRKNQRVSVSGYLRNGIIERATVRRI